MTIQTRTEAELAALVHALEVHQAELEVQNHELVATIDELRSTNLALTHARDRYQALHELAPIPLVTIDRGASIIDVNGAAIALFREKREHLVDRRLALFFAEDERRAIASLVSELFASGNVRDRAATIVVGDATPIDVRIDGVALRDVGPPRVVIAIADVTARVALDAARREADHRAGEDRRSESLAVLAGGIAHEFNNLLTVVLAGTDRMRGVIDTSSPHFEAVEDMHEAASEAVGLAQQMLAYAGRLTVSPRTVDLAESLRDLEPALQILAKPSHLAVERQVDSASIRCDEGQLRQLVRHLVINAAEANANHVRVTTSTGPDATGLVLEVRDDGAGMDEETQTRMFEPYFSTKAIGRGLGLAVVEGIVRSHLATMSVTSALGRGTMVRVVFPAAPPPTAARHIAPASRSGAILVVDDEPGIRRAIVRTFAKAGLSVLVAGNGIDAVDIISSGQPVSLVVMDFSMPGMTGLEAGKAIRVLRPELPIVLISGYRDLPHASESVFDAALGKPFEMSELLAIVDGLLAPS